MSAIPSYATGQLCVSALPRFDHRSSLGVEHCQRGRKITGILLLQAKTVINGMKASKALAKVIIIINSLDVILRNSLCTELLAAFFASTMMIKRNISADKK